MSEIRVGMCKNGHHVDLAKYTVCPICHVEIDSNTPYKVVTISGTGASASRPSPAPAASQPVESVVSKGSDVTVGTVGLFRDDSASSRTARETSSNSAVSSPASSSASGGYASETQKNPNAPMDNYDRVVAISQSKYASVPGNASNAGSVSNAANVDASKVQEAAPAPQNDQNSLMNEVRKVSDNKDGRTVGYFAPAARSSANGAGGSTGAAGAGAGVVGSSDEILDPVVGWLVCIKGNHYGRSYEIFPGRNSIGRNTSNRIVLSNDVSVSREKHAWVVFDMKYKDFYIQPGDSSGMVYMDKQVVMQPQLLANYSEIEVGNNTFRLVPFCTKEFSWEDCPNE